jgi:plastocyanin
MTSNASKTATAIAVVTLAATMIFSGCGGDGGDAADAGHAPAPSGDTPTQAAPTADGPAAPTGTASVTGTIKFDGKAPKLRVLKMDADPGCAKKHSGPVQSEALVLGEGNTMANIFVSVKSGLPGGSYPTPAEAVQLDQNGCQYSPHVTGVMVGQTFKILNSDNLLHNVHSLPNVNASFNRAMPGNVTEAEYTFTKAEAMFKVKCDVHPWMNAWVGVMEHPYFSVTGTDGKFEISGLPAGTYEIEAWHEKMGTRTATVTVADGESKATDMTFAM